MLLLMIRLVSSQIFFCLKQKVGLHFFDSMSLVELMMELCPLKFKFLTVILENGQFKVSPLRSCCSHAFVANIYLKLQGSSHCEGHQTCVVQRPFGSTFGRQNTNS